MGAVHAGPIATKILKHLGLATALPHPEPARPDRQGEFWDTGPPVRGASQAQAWDEFDQRLAACRTIDRAEGLEMPTRGKVKPGWSND